VLETGVTFKRPIGHGIPVLCYHRIGGPLELGVTRVGRALFERQMTALAKAGWRTLTLPEFAQRVDTVGARHAVPLRAHDPPQEFLLSFDDGYASLTEHAYPVLADLGFTATTFLITGYVGKANTWDVRYTWRRLRHLDWPEIERWNASGFDFASHGVTHRRLTWLGDAAATDELGRSRETLIHRLGAHAGQAVAYPFGAVDQRIERLAAQAGYALGFGGVRGDAGSSLHLSRVPVYMWDAGSTPFGLREDALGAMGRLVAHVANRCAVGTSMMQGLGPRRRTSPPPV
jgi:peptidoglycan/xylan/chitin deacetylase (PgdA/CDA1 family)